MTTMAALLGGVPLMLGTGTGAEIRQPLGYTIVGGLMLSQMLTLYTTPVVYLYLDRLGRSDRPSARRQAGARASARRRGLSHPDCAPRDNTTVILDAKCCYAAFSGGFPDQCLMLCDRVLLHCNMTGPQGHVPRSVGEVNDMTEPSQVRISINPQDSVRRQTMSWRGITAEIVQFLEASRSNTSTARPFLFSSRASADFVPTARRVFMAASLEPDDFSRKMLFVPAHHSFKGRFVPRVQLRTAYFYIDPSRLTVDPELEFAALEFSPRLFFDDQVLRGTAEKLVALIENQEAQAASMPRP